MSRRNFGSKCPVFDICWNITAIWIATHSWWGATKGRLCARNCDFTETLRGVACATHKHVQLIVKICETNKMSLAKFDKITFLRFLLFHSCFIGVSIKVLVTCVWLSRVVLFDKWNLPVESHAIIALTGIRESRQRRWPCNRYSQKKCGNRGSGGSKMCLPLRIRRLRKCNYTHL